MKTKLPFLSMVFALLLVCGKAQAQCPEGNQWGEVYLTTQAQVDAFAVNYPNCTEFSGGLIIGDVDLSGIPVNITDLTPLSNLTSVGFIAVYSTQVTSLSGLNNLTDAGEIQIMENHQLTSLSGLENLTTTNNLFIYDNYQLTSLTTFSNLTSITGELQLTGNPLLTSLNGLENLTSVWALYIGGSSLLSSFSGLEGLTDVEIISIFSNSQLTDISALQNIDPATFGNYPDYGLRISNNPLLSVCNLPNFCTYLQGSGFRYIANNAGDCISEQAVLNACATSANQCPEGNQWGEVYLTTQAEVNQFIIDYPNCTEFAGSLIIGDVDLSGIPVNITDLTPLSNLTSVGFIAVYSTQVTSLSGLNNLTNAGEIHIMENHQLMSLSGLENLTAVSNSLSIYDNNQLTSLTVFSNLTSLSDLQFNGNPLLTSLSGLESIISLEFLSIWNNNQLTDISALQNIDPATFFYGSGTNSIGIWDNPLLSVCNLSNICTYLQNGGEIFIENNAGDCISEQAVLNACATPANQCPEGDVQLASQAEVNQFIIDYPNCTEFEGNMAIGDYENPTNITNLSPLSNLISISGELGIYNTQLTSLSGLDNLTSVGGIWFDSNPLLVSLNNLENLTSIGWIYLSSNHQLVSLSGLEGLTSAEVISIYDHNQLTDISALQNIDPQTIYGELAYNGLQIESNPLLSVCNLPNFCTYLQGTGWRQIQNNAGDCISEQAVLNACALGVDDNLLSKITVYPNPVKDILYFSKEIQKLTVTDLTGKVLATQNNISQTDMSNFRSGVYFIVIETENGFKEAKKIVKR